MTQTTLDRPPAKLTPTDVLMNLIITVAGPMLLIASGGDNDLACATAARAVAALKPSNEADLIDIGQIVTFGLAAMEAVALSRRTDFTPAMAHRLRASAVSLNRAAAQTRRNLQKPQPDRAQSTYTQADLQQEEAAVASLAEAKRRLAELKAQAQPQPAQSQPAQPQPAQPQRAEPQPAQPQPAQPQSAAPAAPPPPATEPGYPQSDWHKMLARSMTTVAAELAEDLQNLPPNERKLASMKAQALSSTASHLISSLNPAPAPDQPPRNQPPIDQPITDPPAKNR